jgi:hypothetical protein
MQTAGIAAALGAHCFTVSAHDAVEEMTQSAGNFLKALTPEQRAKTVFEFADKERFNWHFVPMARKGLSFKEMTPEQRLLAHALLSNGLSHRGYNKAVSIMSLETVLKELEGGKGPVRDPELFFLTIFGEPGEKKPWGWRVEGHHLSLNFTTAKEQEAPALTPSFFGSNPGEVKSGPRAGMRILSQEEDLARQLVKSLNDEQRKIAIILQKAPADIFNVPGRSDFTKAEGLPHSQMAAGQKELLVKLIQEYIGRSRPEFAAHDWEKIQKAGLDKIHFAWAGGIEPGEGHYYRVQGETFVLEYDNTQNNANHVHTLWRDFENDFGRDLLKEHYKHGHHKK